MKPSDVLKLLRFRYRMATRLQRESCKRGMIGAGRFGSGRLGFIGRRIRS